MTERVVLFRDGYAHLYLNKIKRDESGKVVKGFVLNGLWDFQIKKGEMLAKDGNYIVSRFPEPEFEEMIIPDTVKGDYEHVMAWAQRHYGKERA